ncbi:hypothetical protein LJR029_000907 [Caballeronia sp. LjRoot29]|uniref:hypothetical protein n=1 Tax=Caballeronia sp. LjRoot29 TaxID=3342315 RepID=UPI003ED0F5B0
MSEFDDRIKELKARAQKSLGIEASAATKRRIEDRLHLVAQELVLEWVVGDRRFENQSQQTEHWLARLYEEVFSDEQPEANRIYARFGMPLPRSQYVARLLLARRSAQWRAAARAEAQTTLENVEAKSLEARKSKSASSQRFELSISPGGYDQLVVLYDFMASALSGPNRPAPPKRLPSSPSLIWFSITAEAVLALLELMRKETK